MYEQAVARATALQLRRREYFRRKGYSAICKKVQRRRRESKARTKRVAERTVSSMRETCHFGPGGGVRQDAYTAEECEELLVPEHQVPKHRRANAFKNQKAKSQGKARVRAKRKERRETRKRLSRKRKRTTRELNRLAPPGAPAPNKKRKAPRQQPPAPRQPRAAAVQAAGAYAGADEQRSTPKAVAWRRVARRRVARRQRG